MGMTKEVIARLYLLNAIEQWSIPPMCARRPVKYHHRWFVGNNHISIIRDLVLLMIIGKAKELKSIYFNFRVLKKVNAFRQIFYTFCIP